MQEREDEREWFSRRFLEHMRARAQEERMVGGEVVPASHSSAPAVEVRPDAREEVREGRST